MTLRPILSILYLSINGIVPRTGIRNQKPSIPSILHPPINGTIPQRELQIIGNRLASVISLPRHRKPASKYYIATASSETGWQVLYRHRVIGNRLASIVSPPRHRKPASEGYIAAASSETGQRRLYRCRGHKKKRKMADHHMGDSQSGQSPKNILQQILNKIQE